MTRIMLTVRRVLLSPFTYGEMEAELGQVTGPPERKKVESGFKSRSGLQSPDTRKLAA